MKSFYYVHTGHRIGLDRFRRSVALLNMLDEDITLLTSDYRIAHESRAFGIKNCVGIDVVQNIPNIANNGDQIIFDSDEANPIMLDDMRRYFSTFIRISDKKDDLKEDNELLVSPYLDGDGVLNSIIVDEKYFDTKKQKDINISYFFGDDDYEKDLEKHFNFLDGLDIYLQLGFYYFLDYEDMLKDKFKNHFEFEEYDDMIFRTKILITSSPQAILESLANGSKPIYIQREDYSHDFNELFEKLNIPIIYNYNRERLLKIIDEIDFIEYENIETNSYKTKKFIKENLNL